MKIRTYNDNSIADLFRGYLKFDSQPEKVNIVVRSCTTSCFPYISAGLYNISFDYVTIPIILTKKCTECGSENTKDSRCLNCGEWL